LPTSHLWFRFSARAARVSFANSPARSADGSQTLRAEKFILAILRRINIVPLAVCPECEAEIHVDEDVDKGEIINCEECEVMLEVVGLDPIELDLAPDEEEEEDYDDEGEY
jgi:alpha-aminoadipate/glutamate carrier protein LysW